MKRYEYIQEQQPLECMRYLDTMGDCGWLLVAVVRVNETEGLFTFVKEVVRGD